MEEQGLFIATYDYGRGNELVPYIKSEMETVLVLICVTVVLIWAISIAIKLLKSYEEVRFYRSFFTVFMICGAFVSYFSIPIWGNMTLSMALIIIDVVGGTIACVFGEILDDKFQEKQERKARFRRQRQIRRYISERGKRRW